MSANLQSSIDGLYRVFARYPLNLRMEACSCCVDTRTFSDLFDGELRELEQSQLVHFASKAATTWGTVDDYRHFLPRILELMTQEVPLDFGLEPWLQARRLRYTRWFDWPIEEREAVEAFWRSWFLVTVKAPPPTENYDGPWAEDLVQAIGVLGLSIKPMLVEWAAAGVEGAQHIAGAVRGLDAYGRCNHLWESAAARDEFEEWIRDDERLVQLCEAIPLTSDPLVLEESIRLLGEFPPLKSSSG